MRVFKLTSEKYAIESICNSRIKVSTINDLNDPYELMGLKLPNKTYREIFKKKREDFAKLYGILCFSKSWKNPVLWSHYGDKHTGVCLCFDVKNELLRDVEYYKSLNAIENSIENAMEWNLLKDLLFRKYSDWSYEQEARCLVTLDECKRDNGLYFCPLSDDIIFKEVIIGPRCKTTPKGISQKIKSSTGKIKIIKSRLAFNSYEVVQNRSYKVLEI